jgi:hypothetical protein
MGMDLYMVDAKGDHVTGNRVFGALMGWSMVKGDDVATDCIRGNVATRLIDLHCGIDIRSMEHDQYSRLVSNDDLQRIVVAMKPKVTDMCRSLADERWNYSDAVIQIATLYAWFQYHANLGHHMRVSR